MKKTNSAKTTPLYTTKLAKIQFSLAAVYAVYIIIFDAGNVLTREAVYHRWIMAAAMLVIFTLFWVSTKKASTNISFVLLAASIISQLIFAGFSVYWERGMASMSTLLFAVPIICMSLSGSRTYTMGTALLAATAYIVACTKYFYDFFNEGYRVQLYGQLFFFAAILLLIGWASATVAHAYSKK